VYVEAESGYVASPMTAADDPDASGGRHVWTPNQAGGQGRVLWNLEVPDAGVWHLWGRVLAPTPKDDSFYVDVYLPDGRQLGRVDWHTGLAKTWRWVRLTAGSARHPVALPLPKGKVRLEICTREDGTKLDRLFFAPDADRRPD